MNSPIAILCSGQGGQYSGMFDLFAEIPECEPIFAAASVWLGQDPRELVRSAGADLFADHTAQILCCTQALAAWAGLAAAQPARAVIAGYSAGELPAWGCAGAIEVEATLRWAHHRAAVMDAAAPRGTGLAAIVGLSRTKLQPMLRRHGAAIAIIDPNAYVVGGYRSELEACCRDAIEGGATRAFMLPVAVPSHTKLLAAAATAFRGVLHEANPRLPRAGFRLLSGIDGDVVRDIEAGWAKLALQICTQVDWAACLESCRAEGAQLALELGPGRALTHMAEAIFPPGCARATEDFRSIAGLRAWLSRNNDWT
jgi:[acyl-carrier-protein] S-malonyltransferase